jgi:PAS domain-containing protein
LLHQGGRIPIVRLHPGLRYGLHGLLAVVLVVGAAAAWQMLHALDDKAEALSRHFRVDIWAAQDAEIKAYRVLHAMGSHVAGSPVALADIRGRLTGLRQAIALLDTDRAPGDLDALQGADRLVRRFGRVLDEVEALLDGRATWQGDRETLARAEALLTPFLTELRRLASSLAHIHLELQDRDAAKVSALIGLNRWLLLTVVGVAVLFIALLGIELLAARRAEARARSERARFQDFAEIASDWMFEADQELRLSVVSAQVEASTGRPAAFYIGRPALALITAGEAEGRSPASAALEARRPFRDVVLSFEHGQRVLRLSGTPVFSGAGAFLGYRGIGTYISSEVQRKERIRFLAQHDALTGLYNRGHSRTSCAQGCRPPTARSARWRCWCSISTASRTSTTLSATISAMP